MQINLLFTEASRCICEIKCKNDIPVQLKVLGKGLISLNQRGAVWSISKKMKMTPMTMTIFCHERSGGGRQSPVHAGDGRF